MNKLASRDFGDRIGSDLRALRKKRGVTISDLADRLDRSTGWLSQIERGISQPSIDDLRAIAGALGFPVSILFGEADAAPDEAGFVVRARNRRKISGGEGLTEQLLSPDLTDDFEVVHSVFAPGARLDGVRIRQTQELGYLVSGRLDVQIAGREFTIQAGDSFRIRGDAYSWANPYDDPAVAIWVIAPPVY